MTAQSHRLGSVCQEVQDLITQGGADSEITELGDQPGGDDCIEGGAEANELHLNVCVPIFHVGEGRMKSCGNGILCRSVSAVHKLEGIQ